MNKHHYHKSEPQPIKTDLPHLRDGGKWSANNGLPKRRMEMYLGWLKALGMTDVDAQCMMSDLYWDCFNELEAAARILPANAKAMASADKQPPPKETTL